MKRLFTVSISSFIIVFGQNKINIDDIQPQENIFYEKQGDTNFSITKGIFYIPDLKAKMSAFRVMKHTNYSKPIVEYCFKKVQAETVLKDLMTA